VAESTQDAWNEVGQRFEELGRVLRGHFESEPEPETPAGPEAGPATGDRAAMKDALRRFGQAAQRFGEQAGETVRDPAVRESAQSAARSFGVAVEATFSEFADEVRTRMQARRGGEQAGRDSAAQPPAEPKELGGQPGAPSAREGDYPPGPS
jgi:hypothetical protein